MPAGVGVFSVLPGNFFSPLASPNREHYAALLVLYYRLFQENTSGLERELVIREFLQYLALHRDSLAEEEGEDNDGTEARIGAEPAGRDLDFGSPLPPAPDVPPSMEKDRELANRFLRRLIRSGWLGEEILADYTKLINITAWGKPFFEALVRVDEGLKTEYESHVVNVYSSLCGETVRENGHFMTLTAHQEARSLIDSLKVLSQSIKGHYQKLNSEAVRAGAASVLREHYDEYAGEVLDKAYKRLKTSDNVSRYRQSIFKKIAELLCDNEWLDASAGKYVRILQTSRDECRKRLEFMLEEIRDDLRSVDPLEDEIDRRNADYSSSSTEIIKAYIEPDSTIAGKLGILIKAVHSGNEELRSRLAHGLFRVRFLSPASLAFRRQRDEGDFSAAGSTPADREALAKAEEEFLERMRRRLSIKRIGAWLDEQGGKEKILAPAELVGDEESYIRFVYALLYGDSRNGFGYRVEENDGGAVRAGAYVVPDIRFRRGREAAGTARADSPSQA